MGVSQIATSMNRLLPSTLRPDFSILLPRDAAEYRGPMLALWFAVAFLVVITMRRLIHLLAPDGGAHSIATIDTSVAGGSNIIAVFGQWGAIQLLLAALLWVLLVRCRGLAPLVLLVFLIEPFMRGIAGHLKPLETVGTAPGAELNWWVVPVMAVTLWVSICPSSDGRHA